MPSSVKMRTLLETGVHFGHRTNRWDPKMDEFIFTARNGIHIIDLQQTLVNLNEYYDMVRDIIADGGSVLFCGTKRQAQETIEQEARRCGMPYVNQRWLGGTLTNWKTIRSRIETMKQLEKDREEGVFELLTKKEALINERKIQKLLIRLGGLRDMKRIPDLVIIVDTEREHTAVHEANILNIPILGIVDTNANPDHIDYIIPGNDDAMRSIRLLVGAMADAVLEGKAIRKGGDIDDGIDVDDISSPVVDFGDNADDEELLGESTLKKLRNSKLDFDEDDDE
ncbi:MAG: 30S ribosomal protein S2 [Phototrophicaceae bacterium]